MIPITKPLLGDDEIKQVGRVIKSGWVTQGKEVEAFESEFKEYVNTKYAIALSSCTAALHLALKVVGVDDDDEVITVSHSYIATANSIRYCGAIPVFIDIEPNSFNINPELIKPAISKKTKAILCVHQIGMPCDLSSIIAIGKEYNIPVIEDAACAVGSEIKLKNKWEKIGKPHGDLACFSFHPRKLITTGDGGMITTNNKNYDKKIRLWRQHAISIDSLDRHNSKELLFEDHLELGYNYRMTDIQAAVGRVQLKKLSQILMKRREKAFNYNRLLNESNFSLPYEPIWAKSNWQSYCIGLPENVQQSKIIKFLKNEGISTKRGVMNSHEQKAYKVEPWSTGHNTKDCSKLINSEIAFNQSLLIPLFTQLSNNEQKLITELLISKSNII